MIRRGGALAAAAAFAAAFAVPGCVAPGPRSVRFDVPPDVQRAPGWCAPASLSRALAFSGIGVDQAELARRGGCTPDGGADVATFCRSLEVYLALRGLRLSPLFETDASAALALARRYDAEAAPAGDPPLASGAAASSGELALEELFSGAAAEPMRRASASRLPRFRRAVARALSCGRPALWGVVLGIVPESGPPGAAARGGHVRLVVGYDAGSRRVLYSDPWAPDCAVKEMDEADACAITMSLWALEDRPGPVVIGKH